MITYLLCAGTVTFVSVTSVSVTSVSAAGFIVGSLLRYNCRIGNTISLLEKS